MKSRIQGSVVVFLLTTTCMSAEEKPSVELSTITEAYKAAKDNLVSGSGIGVYEIYTARAGKGNKMALSVKAKANISFDHGSFHIRLDYEKDDLYHLESRAIVFDGTAILVHRKSKHIHPTNSEGEVYEAIPTLPTMRKTGFDYNPCTLPYHILQIDKLPEFAKALTIKPDSNMNYFCTFDSPPVVHCTFIVSHDAGYNVINYRQYNKRHNDFQHVNLQAAWEQKKGLWYVKSIDRQYLSLDGSGERAVFRYTNFEPNAEVSPSLFKFDSLGLAPTTRVIDRRPNVEERVLHQSNSSKVDAAKLDNLADTVKSLTPSSAHPQPPRLGKKYLLISGLLVFLLGLLLLWRKRSRKGTVIPKP